MIFSKISPRRASWSKVGAAFAATLFATGSLAYGQGYNTNFNTASDGTTFSQATLSAQGGWDTNDGYKGPSSTTPSGDAGQSDYVGPITYTQGMPALFSGQQGSVGGLFRSSGNVPTSTTVYVEHGFSPVGATSYTFTTDFEISQPTGATARDSFGFTFGTNLEGSTTNGVTARLFSLNFSPDLSGAGNSANQMIISTTDYAAGNTTPVIPTVGGVARTVAYNGAYHLVLSVNAVTNTLNVSIAGANTFTFSTTLTAGEALAAREFAATWVLSATGLAGNGTTGYTSAGSNALILDNLSLAVPEPSTWAMLGAGVLGLAAVLRRRVRA